MTPWEKEILHVLANHLSAMSLAQAARTWWPGQRRSLRNAADSARALSRRGWSEIYSVLSRPVSQLSEPLLLWTPGQPAPDFHEVSKWLHRRALRPASLTRILVPTQRTLAMFGDGEHTRRIKLTQMTHDLHVAEVFLAYRCRGQQHQWVGERRIAQNWPISQRPDALLVDRTGAARRAIEYGGDYPFERLAALHHGLATMGLSYEIW